MADLNAARTDAEHQLWEEIDGVNAGMLGIEGSDASQPMAPEVDREAKTIWFFAHKSADLAKAAAKPGARGTFTVVGKDHDYHASLSGTLEEHVDPAVRDRFWNSMIEAWFERGKKDPDLTMLALKLDHGHIWASTDSSLKYSWQIAKASMTGAEPEVGVSRQLNF